MSKSKQEIILKLEVIQKDLDRYLAEWKKTGGGTRGHAIGSMMARVKEYKEFFKNYC